MQTSGEAMYMVFDLEPKGKYNVTDRVCSVCDIFTSEDHGPRIGDDWIPGAVACLTAKTRKLLINLREFEFTRHEKYNLPTDTSICCQRYIELCVACQGNHRYYHLPQLLKDTLRYLPSKTASHPNR